ncbi:unnamed protein product [Linum trigynum]|uniref:MULE transposase domain-containing protein n=1 Tax=Linum trigynum TaxID=586398 RepID=A0AAV2FEV3_9ROSI
MSELLPADRDYTQEFENGIHYASVELAELAARTIAQQCGFFIVRGAWKPNTAGLHPVTALCMYCDRSSRIVKSYKPDPMKETRGNISSKGTGCQFQICLKEVWQKDGPNTWVIVGVTSRETGANRGFHNHEKVLYPEHHRHNKQFSEAEKERLRLMRKAGVRPNQQKTTLNTEGGVHHDIKQMYNINSKTRLDEMGEMDAIQFALHGAEHRGYHICLQKDSNNVLTNLFFAHPTSIQMLHAWPYVILIDSTYKTNRYSWPWVEIIGVTPVKKNFNIACAIIKQETKETYEWLLRCIKGFLGDTVPNVIVTDKEGGLLASIPVVFPLPHTVHLLCLWHVNNCVKQKFEVLLGGIAKREVAQAVWKKYFDKAAWSWTQEGFLQKINEFERVWTVKNIKMVDYVRGEWLPHQTMWAKCYTNHVFHLGNTSSNRVESSHSSFKTFLVSGRGAIDTCFAKNHNYMEHQFLEVVNELHNSLNRNLSKEIEPPCTFLKRVVSSEAIKLMLDGAAELKDSCACHFQMTHGLKCACQIVQAKEEGRQLYAQELHVFWRTLDYKNPPRQQQVSDEIELQREHFRRLTVEVEERGPEAVRQARDALFYGLHPAEDNVREPELNENPRGWPRTSTSRIRSYYERSRSRSTGPGSSGGRGRSSGGRSRSSGG